MSRVLGMDALNQGAIRSAVRFYSSVHEMWTR